MPSAARALLLASLLLGCGHASVARDNPEAPDPPAVTRDSPVEEAPAPTKPDKTAQVITFTGDDADPEPTTQVRTAPQRPKIPSFQLFGTRPGDGPQ